MNWKKTQPLPRHDGEMPAWESDIFLVAKRLEVTNLGEVVHIIVAPKDGKKVISWEELQEIKNDFLGHEATAVEYFPPESKVVNQTNFRHLWSFIDFQVNLPRFSK